MERTTAKPKESDYRPRLQARPPRLRRLPVIHAVGPEFVGRRRPATVIVGPGPAPAGFVTATTSKSEWMIYWALAKVSPEGIPDPRRAPFFGGLYWDYQRAVLGDWTRAPGSAVLDFVFYGPGRRTGIRLVSRYWHIAQPPAQKAFDRVQRARLEAAGFRVADVYEEDFFGDETGRAAILVVKGAIGQFERIDPVAAARSLARG